MKSLLTYGALALAVMAAPIAVGSAQAEDSHHPVKAASTKSTPVPATKKARKVRPAKASMMSNCQTMHGGQKGRNGGMICPQDQASMTGPTQGMHSMMMRDSTIMGRGNKSRGH